MNKPVALTLAAALLAVLALAAADLAGWPGLAPRLAMHANRGLTLAPDSRLHLLWRPRLEAPELRLNADATELARAQGLTLTWHWSDLWAWRQGAPLRLRQVEADTLTLDWRRDAAGHTHWPLGARDAGPTPLPQLDHLVIRAGTARLDDAPLQLQGEAHFATAADGRWTAELQGRLRGQDLALTAQADAGLALLSPPQAGLAPVKLRAELKQGPDRIRFDGTAASLLDARALDGELFVQGRSLASVGRPFGVVLPQTPPLALTGRLQHASGVWQLHAVSARIGRSKLGGEFAFDTRSARPVLSGMLTGGPLRLADLGPAVGTDTTPSRPGRVLPDRPIDLPALHAMDAHVAMSLSQLDLGSAALAPLAPLNASLTLVAGDLRLDALSTGVAGGRITGSARLDTRESPPLWQGHLQAQGLVVERWFRPVDKTFSASPLTGQLHADIDVQGRGHSTAALLGSLSGPVQLQLEKGSVSHLLTEAAGLDLAQGLGLWLSGDKQLALDCARLDGQFQAGVLRPRVAVIDNRDSRIELDGRINLATETLALRVVAKPKDFSPLTLRAPLRVEGTLAQPRVALEGKALGGRALAAIALGTLAPPAALLAFVDPGERLPPLVCGTQRPRPTS